MEAAAYLDAALEDDDLEYLLLALQNVAEARQGCSDFLTTSSMNWDECYELLNSGDSHGLLVVSDVLKKLGLKLSVVVPEQVA